MQAPSFIPAGAWLKPDGTVDITVGGALLEGGQGVLMQDALTALKRYASRYGTLLMTTLHPDGRSTTDMVYGDGAIVQYTPNGVMHAPPGIPTVEELEDVFGLPPLGHEPARAGLGASRADAFPGRPAFRPLGLADSYYDAPVFAGSHEPASGGRFHTGHRHGPSGGRPMPPPSPFDAPFETPAGALPDLDLDFFAVHEKALPPVAPPAQVHRRRGRRPLRAALQLLVVVVIAVIVTIFAPHALAGIQDFIHPAHPVPGVSPAGQTTLGRPAKQP